MKKYFVQNAMRRGTVHRGTDCIVIIELLFSEPSFIDVMSTPSLNKADKTGSSFFRTPGQVLSLTSNFTFVS